MPPAILLVDDDENDVLLTQMALEQAGVSYPVHIAKNGREALDYVRGSGNFSDREKYPAPYLVLLDVKLPYVPGLEVLRQVRERPEFDAVIVIMLTSSNDPKDIDEAYRLRANAYVVKPSGLDALQIVARGIKEFWLTLNQRSSAFG